MSEDTMRVPGREASIVSCNREFGPEANYARCGKPAELIVWGKLFPPEALGPRCYDCCAEQTDHHIAGEVYKPPDRRQCAVYVLPREPRP